ncbi:methylamine dehydrogenase (amicyanin) large subunit [Microvirga massiliensis]|uniref:methylamine dehydrogenase (amicyanin) large subunit n=1 Tax=Microvirga massiliensis TaxID=1033741 RepID=UPI00062B6D90|nr:methylamine dehydrogenase (amicyanin) large subunit [Microvirga massiliensis]
MTHVSRKDKIVSKYRSALLSASASLALLLSGSAMAQQPGAAPSATTPQGATQGLPVDEPVILKAPAPNARRVYVSDVAHFNAVSQMFTIDGEKGRVLGMTDGGFLPNAAVANDGSFFALASTVFSRIARGKRTDYVEVFDSQTHDPIADIELPNQPRFLVGTYPWMTALTPDNKHLLFYQFSPSPAVGLVNLADKKFVKMLEVPDCYHIFPSAKQDFFMHCRDGSMLKVTFKEDGSAETKKSQVFHKEDDYLINHPAYSMKAGRIVWPTYTGKIFQVDVSSNEAKFPPAFEAFTDAEKADRWAPGGWQQVAYHRQSDRIFLLADQRDKWTHKTASRFVFVYDAKNGQRIKRIDLGHEIDSIAVSQENTPQLYALSTGDKTLYIFDPETGKETMKVNELGHGPQVIYTTDM